MKETSEFVLTLMASLAEEESRSISNNIRWSVKKRFEQGKKGLRLRESIYRQRRARKQLRKSGQALYRIHKPPGGLGIQPLLYTLRLGDKPVYIPARGLSEKPYGTLFGRPVVPLEQCSAAGETGDIVPPAGYLKKAREICTRHNILFIADEVQTGFARTGKIFACMHENVAPDIYVLGKALGGGILPVSAIAANDDIMSVFNPGSHGSTFGGNPLAAAVGLKVIEILVRDDYAGMAAEKGAYFMAKLKEIANTEIIEIRGKGLLIGVEFSVSAAPYVAKLIENGILAKETHENTIRFAPPIVITYAQLDAAILKIKAALIK